MSSSNAASSASSAAPDARLNCWEFYGCGREPGGANCEQMGVCPAAIETERLGPNRGTGYGRYCWRSAGTLCGGRVQGSYLAKARDCRRCPFYELVKQQEGDALRE